MLFKHPLVPPDVFALWNSLWLQDNVTNGRLTGENAVIFGEPVFRSYFEDNIRQPKWGCYVTQHYIAVLCSGLWNMQQGVELHNSWSILSELNATYGHGRIAWAWAENIMDRCLRSEMNSPRDIFLVGHSGGGPTMEALCRKVDLQRPGAVHTIITGGAPRCVLSEFSDSLPNCARFRFMFPYDPVCYLPPHQQESPASWAAEAALRTLANGLNEIGQLDNYTNGTSPWLWQRMIHAGGGRMIWDDGQTMTTPHPLVPRSAIDEVVQWLWIGDVRHSKALYRLCLQQWSRRWLEANPGGPRLVVFEEQPEVEGPRSPGSPMRQPEQPEPPVVWGDNFVLPLNFIARDLLMQTTPIVVKPIPADGGGTTYAVFLGGKQVAVYDSRGRANTCQRFLKKWLARLSTAVKVDRDNMIMGLNSYLDSAAAGQGVTNDVVMVS